MPYAYGLTPDECTETFREGMALVDGGIIKNYPNRLFVNVSFAIVAQVEIEGGIYW